MSEILASGEDVSFAPFDELVAALKLNGGYVDVTILRDWNYRVSVAEPNLSPVISVGSLQKKDAQDIVVPMYVYSMGVDGRGLGVAKVLSNAESLCPKEYRDPETFFRGVSYMGRFIVNGVV